MINQREQRNWQKKRYIKNNVKEKNTIRKQALTKIKIKKGLKCEMCKNNPAEERHHTDYSKPLEVILLCKKCHAKLRRKD